MKKNNSLADTVIGQCPICSGIRAAAFSALILNRYPARFVSCRACGLLQAEDPSWLDEAYEDPIAAADTGILQRNLLFSRLTAVILSYALKQGPESACVDVAAGYGVLVRLLRDAGFNFHWNDPYCENLFAKGFESRPTDKFSVATAFEVAEHVRDPVAFFRSAIESTGAESILFSTTLFSGPPPKPETWWYYSFATGQHISFYQEKTLREIALQLGKRLYSSGSLHLFTGEKLAPGVFALLTNQHVSRLLYFLLRRKMHSRTFDDHVKLT